MAPYYPQDDAQHLQYGTLESLLLASLNLSDSLLNLFSSNSIPLTPICQKQTVSTPILGLGLSPTLLSELLTEPLSQVGSSYLCASFTVTPFSPFSFPCLFVHFLY